MFSFFKGLGLGFSLILAIGAQNAFVLKHGLKQRHVFWICLICALSDSVLILLGIFGFAHFIHQYPMIITISKYLGALFLFCYGAVHFYEVFKKKNILDIDQVKAQSLQTTILITLAFTWLNPHVYLDTVILVGSVASQFLQEIYWFAMGAVLSSWIFFFSLGYGAKYLQPILSKPNAWKILDACIGLVMWTIAIKLLM